MRAGHAELLRALVHPVDAQFFGSVEHFGQRDGGVVGAADDHALEQHVDRLRLAHVQQHLRTAHARRRFRDRHDVVQRDAPVVDRLQRQQDRHDLGDRRDRARRIGVHFKDDLAALRFEQQRGGAVQRHWRRVEQRRAGQFDRRGRGSWLRALRGEVDFRARGQAEQR